MKKILISTYLAIALIISPFYWQWGEYSYMSYAYNLGAALMWPRSLFRSYPEIDGRTPFQFMNSFAKVEQSGKPEGHIAFYDSIGFQALYQYADATPSVTQAQVEKMLSSYSGMNTLFTALLENPDVVSRLRESLDGKTFGDIVRERDDWEEDLFDLVEDRVPSTTEASKPSASTTPPPAQINWSLNEDALRALNPSASEMVVDGSSDNAMLISLRAMVASDNTGQVASSILSLTCLTSAQVEMKGNNLNAIAADLMEEGCEYGQDELAFQGGEALFNDLHQQDIAAFRNRLAGKSGAEIMAMKQGIDAEFQSILSAARQ